MWINMGNKFKISMTNVNVKATLHLPNVSRGSVTWIYIYIQTCWYLPCSWVWFRKPLHKHAHFGVDTAAVNSTASHRQSVQGSAISSTMSFLVVCDPMSKSQVFFVWVLGGKKTTRTWIWHVFVLGAVTRHRPATESLTGSIF